MICGNQSRYFYILNIQGLIEKKKKKKKETGDLKETGLLSGSDNKQFIEYNDTYSKGVIKRSNNLYDIFLF